MHINYAIVLFRPLRNMSKDFGDLKITSDLLAILYSYFMPVCSMVYSYFMPVCSIVYSYFKPVCSIVKTITPRCRNDLVYQVVHGTEG